MQEVLVLLAITGLCLAAPQVGFGIASDQDISEIQAGTFQEDFNDAPQYNFNYKVSDEDEQTYIAMEEERAGDTVTGTYSYVDPLGSLIIVTYSAGPMGYTETREVQKDFVTIRARPVRTQTVNAVATAEAQRLQAQRLEAQRLDAQRLEAQKLEAQRLEAQRLDAQRLEAQRLETQRLEAQRLEAQRLDNQRIEAERLQAQRLAVAAEAQAAAEAARLEAASAANSHSNIVSQIVAQIQPLVSHHVTSAVNGQRQSSSSSGSSPGDILFTSQPIPTVSRPIARPITRIRLPSASLIPPRIPLGAVTPLVATTTPTDLSGLFGQGGTYNVRINTPAFNIEY